MCPIVPMLRCGLVRSNLFFAMVPASPFAAWATSVAGGASWIATEGACLKPHRVRGVVSRNGRHHHGIPSAHGGRAAHLVAGSGGWIRTTDTAIMSRLLCL